jgi:hypothetical protein
MPKTSYKESLPRSDADALFGHAALIEGVPPRTAEGWTKEVPAHRVLKLLKARSLPLPDADRSILIAARSAMDSIDRTAWEFFVEVVKHRDDLYADQWELLLAAVRAAMKMPRRRANRKGAKSSGRKSAGGDNV